ncbi:LIF receptor subunit alpha a [Periophthalmus magnuspinnatus]|uniref:LIF receptor subunit alpha a n=1 Tax=Periophthalmus magnuspinnatus TaxID=409849 RepID=UPI00145C1265|nr:LIF receptor subunit alpha a [Periophthalmus magnuspinnatus]
MTLNAMQLLKFTWLLIVFMSLSSWAKDVIPIPQQVSLSENLKTQQVSISWVGGEATTFDLLILRTELNDTVFYETVTVAAEASGQSKFLWTSAEPLECTSLSFRVRSRSGQLTSDWSSTQILQGNDSPTDERMQAYPQDKTVPAGSNITFCCIIGEGKSFDSFHFISESINVTRLSRRTYAATVYNLKPSRSYGHNAYCKGKTEAELYGAVIFVGYPPLFTDFICETHDLTSAVCHWTEPRKTQLLGRRQTRYSINGRNCSVVHLEQNRKQCSFPRWEENWKLLGWNPLGEYSLTDIADVRSRVVPLPPEELSTVANARNATVTWQWKLNHYVSLPLVCQVELMSSDDKTKRTFSGVGLRSATLLDLYPYEEYSVKVRCGAQQNFWRWGNWSKTISFQTDSEIPSAPDVWMWMNGDTTGQILWKPYEPRKSHGPIVSYEVTLWSPDDITRHTQIVSPETFAMPVNLSGISINNTKVIASVVAKNPAGLSPPESLGLPLHVNDLDSEAITKVDFREGAFPLSWQSDANSSCGYIVEWYEASCQRDCPVEWIKVGEEITNVSIKSDAFEPGVRYYFSLYSCSSEAPELLKRWEGYTRELAPSSSVQLSTEQQDSDILISWSEIPSTHRRGFLLGYNVYLNNGSQLTKLASLSTQENSYTVKGFPLGSYKFTVKAFTSAGEDTGGTASITLESSADWLIFEILATLGVTALALIIVTFVCYKKRKWVKSAFYPAIPEPKVPSDWSTPHGTLDVKPSPHSMVHIVEKPEWDSSKEVLVVIPEEDEDDEGQGIRDEPVDTDEPTSLRYYNQVVDERPIRPRYPDSSASSASSMDSGRTDVTYTGIQTSGSSLVFQSDSQSSSDQPLVVPESCGGADGGYRPQMQLPPENDNASLAQSHSLPESQACRSGGYRPQNNWQLDSPDEADERRSLAPSLGSPTSIASTQFLLPDQSSDELAEEKHQSSAATWLTNLLSTTKP